MRELLKYMLRILITEYILYKLSHLSFSFRMGLFLPKIYQTVLPCCWHFALQIQTLFFLEKFTVFIYNTNFFLLFIGHDSKIIC